MLGALLINYKRQICFVDVERNGGIAAFRYISGMRVMLIVRKDGSEDMFTSEIATDLHDVLRGASELLIVQPDPSDPRRATSEVMVSLTVVP